MTTFQILDKDGYPADLDKLDEKIAEFWGVKYSPGFYACPQGRKSYLYSWFQVIGDAISNLNAYCCWDNIIRAMCADSIGAHVINGFKLEINAKIIKSIQDEIAYFTPYVELIAWLANQGYRPKRIEYVK